MLAERPPLFFLAFVALFALAATLAVMLAHGSAAVRTPGFALIGGFGVVLGLGETMCVAILARVARQPAAADARAAGTVGGGSLGLVTLALLAVAVLSGATLGYVWPVFRNIVQ